MFGLNWFVVVVVWSDVGNISFPSENGLVEYSLVSKPICKVRCDYRRRAGTSGIGSEYAVTYLSLMSLINLSLEHVLL